MNALKVLILAIITSTIFISCDTEARKIPEFMKANPLQTRAVQEVQKPQIKQSEKMSVADAATLIGSMVKQSYVYTSSLNHAGRGFGGGLQFANSVGLGGGKSGVIEKTTSEIWKNFNVQVFTFANKTYFVRDKNYAYVMGSVMIDYVIVDMNRNSIPEIFYIGNYNYDGPPIVSATAPAPPTGNIVRLFTEDKEMTEIFSKTREIINSRPKKLEKVSSTKLKLTAIDQVFYITLADDNGQKKFVLSKK